MNTTPFLSKTRIFGLLFSLVLLGFLGSCAKGPNDTEPGSTQTTTIYGRITDESGAALSGVNVTAGTQSATTDANGIYVIKNASVPKGRAVILAKKAGYFNGARAEAPGKNGATKIELSIMASTTTANVSGTSGGTANVTGGAKIKFAASSFTTASGASYTGTVNVAARYLTPTSPSFYDYFSGDNEARTADGNTASLVSSGVLRVAITGTTGEELKLVSPATLTYPKSPDAHAPTTMPLWYYDETLGMWKEEGSATLNGGVYTGTVTHFTDWNLDYKDSSTEVTLRVVCNGAPVEGVVVSLLGDDQAQYYVHVGAITGPDGVIRFRRFPADRTVQVEIRSDKNKGVFYINTPIDVKATPNVPYDMGDISLNSPCPATIQGTLIGCDDSKAEGLVTVTYGTNIKYIYTKNGDFSLQVPTGVAISVNAMDVAGNNGTAVDVAPLASGELRLIGNVKVCGTLKANFIDLSDPSLTGEGNILGLSPDGSKLAVVTNKTPATILIFETATGKKLMEITLAGTRYYNATLQFSTDNKRLLVASLYDSTKVYDISGTTGSLLRSVANLTYAHLSDDGMQIIGGSGGFTATIATIKIYSANDGSVIKTLTIPATVDSSGGFGFDRKENAAVFATASSPVIFSVWSIDNDNETRNFTPSGASNYYNSYSEDGERLAVSSDFKNWGIYNTTTGVKMNDLMAQGTQGSTNRSGVLLTNSYLFSSETITGGTVIKYTDLTTGLVAGTKIVFGTTYIHSIAASRSENYLAASFNGGVRLWKLK